MTSKWRRADVDPMSYRRIGVSTTSCGWWVDSIPPPGLYCSHIQLTRETWRKEKYFYTYSNRKDSEEKLQPAFWPLLFYHFMVLWGPKSCYDKIHTAITLFKHLFNDIGHTQHCNGVIQTSWRRPRWFNIVCRLRLVLVICSLFSVFAAQQV